MSLPEPTFTLATGQERGHLTRAQIQRLLKPVRSDRVEAKQGMTYVPQHEIRAELVRIFGPGNVDHTMTKPELLYEYQQDGTGVDYKTGQVKNAGKPYYVTAYMVGCTLRVRDYQGRQVAEFTEYHVEENSPLPNRGEAHAMAVTSAQSYALRRAAISLGDALGLHLYANGSLAPLIAGSLQLQGDPDSPLYVAPAAPEEGAEPAPVEKVRTKIDGAFKKPAEVQAKLDEMRDSIAAEIAADEAEAR